MTGGLAIFAVAIRQHKDSLIQSRTAQFPQVVRDTESGKFNWDKSLFLINQFDPSSKDILMLKIARNTFVSNLRGYIIHQGFIYPLLFANNPADFRSKLSSAGGQVVLDEKQTWAEGECKLIVVPLVEKKRAVGYKGSYYCVQFNSSSGYTFFLEEDNYYDMRLIPIEEGRPKYGRDFLFHWYLNDLSE